jgi:hypothetical protein
MSFLTASVIFGPLMLISTLPATAAPSTLVHGSSEAFQLAAGGGWTADVKTERDTYTQKALGDIHEWKRKLNDFSKTADAKGKEAGNASENELKQAWTKADAASRKLQVAGDDDWETARASFEDASHELAGDWNKVQIRDK